MNRAQPFLAVGGIAQRFVQRLPHHRPVRQAGQRIEAGEAGDLALRPALLGQVGADAAETEEAAAIVEDRIARQRPVNVLLAGRANDDVGEGEARRQVEAQRLAFFQRRPAKLSTDSRSVNWRPSSSSGSHWKSSASWRDT